MAGKLKLLLRGVNPFRTNKSKKVAPKQEPTNTPDFEPPENLSTDPTFFERSVLEETRRKIQYGARGEVRDLLNAWLDTIVADNGVSDTAEMIMQAAEHGEMMEYEIGYKKDDAIAYINNAMKYLPEGVRLYEDQVWDKLQYMGLLSDALENSEDWESPE